MAKAIKLIVYPAKDIDQAKTFFSKLLGSEPYVDSPYYVGYRIGELEIGLDPNTDIGPISYIDTTDIKTSIKDMTDSGAEIVQDIKDVANGLLVAQVKDVNGNVCGFRQQP